jgi:hypothetical protein
MNLAGSHHEEQAINHLSYGTAILHKILWKLSSSLEYLPMALQPFVGPWPLFSFLILYTFGRTPWTRDQPVARPLPILRTTQTQNKCKQTSMPRVGFEAETVHALDHAATVIGFFRI